LWIRVLSQTDNIFVAIHQDANSQAAENTGKVSFLRERKMHNSNWRVSGYLIATFVGALFVGLATAPQGASAANLLKNSDFDTPSGTGPTSFTGLGNGGQSAARDWTVYNNNEGTTTTELLPSTLVEGGTMIHISASGADDGIYQTFTPAQGQTTSCAWIYVISGAVAIGAGQYVSDVAQDAALLDIGEWQPITVNAGNQPAGIMIIYSSYFGSAEYYGESASISSSTAQCKPK
jgi:hypothetical protein